MWFRKKKPPEQVSQFIRGVCNSIDREPHNWTFSRDAGGATLEYKGARIYFTYIAEIAESRFYMCLNRVTGQDTLNETEKELIQDCIVSHSEQLRYPFDNIDKTYFLSLGMSS